MRTFILLSAIPGCGKSTWAKRYASEHPNTHTVSSDEIRRTHFGAVNNFDHDKETWEIFLQEIHRFGEEDGSTVIADSTNITNAYRQYYAEQTPEFDRKILVCFHIPYEIALKQNAMREGPSVVPLPVMEKMRREFEKPNQKTIDLFDEYLIIGKSFVSEELKEKK